MSECTLDGSRDWRSVPRRSLAHEENASFIRHNFVNRSQQYEIMHEVLNVQEYFISSHDGAVLTGSDVIKSCEQ